MQLQNLRITVIGLIKHQSQPTAHVIQIVTTTANTHLQKGEKGKLVRVNKTYF